MTGYAILLVAGVLLGLGVGFACGPPVPGVPAASPTTIVVASPARSPAASPVPASEVPHASPASRCHYQGTMPDPACTPGFVDPRVTQANIHTTICVAGYTASVRADLTALKRQQMREYGQVTPEGVLLSAALYREDHRVPLEVGGHPSDPRNLWPQPVAAAAKKDPLENYIKAQVCSSAMSLQDGQAVFLGDFEAWQRAGP